LNLQLLEVMRKEENNHTHYARQEKGRRKRKQQAAAMDALSEERGDARGATAEASVEESALDTPLLGVPVMAPCLFVFVTIMNSVLCKCSSLISIVMRDIVMAWIK